MGTLWTEVELAKKDAKDFYLLASVVVNRTTHSSTRPAVFMNANSKEFDPREKKVPESFYNRHRLIWRRDFSDLPTAVGKRRSRFAAG